MTIVKVVYPPPPPPPIHELRRNCRVPDTHGGSFLVHFISQPPHRRFSFMLSNLTTRSTTTTVRVCKENSMITKPQPLVKIVAIVGEGSISPLNSAPWLDVMLHTAKRLKWIEKKFEMRVFNDNFYRSSETTGNLVKELSCANILVTVAVIHQESVDWIQSNTKSIPNIICFESSSTFVNKLGGVFVEREGNRNIFREVVKIFQAKKAKEAMNIFRTVSEAWDRHNSDVIRFSLLVIINAYVTPVPILENMRSQGFSTLICMVKNCGHQTLNCLLDPNCRKALQCLIECSPDDQVCKYKCLASNESPILDEFSLWVLQKHNCLGFNAKIPEKPFVPPMEKFRGVELSHETAEDLLVGWLGSLDWSWRVVAGKNPAYDIFPCQYQLFYRGKAKGSFWCEPVFQVKTLDGKMVWRRKKYRVKRGEVPCTFNFSGLDTGVVSNEFWTIVEVADDFSWGLFHYSGAARVVGISYTGVVLVSPNGKYPIEKERQRLISALDRCCVKEWELFNVDNSSCQDPPLGIPEGSSLKIKIRINH